MFHLFQEFSVALHTGGRIIEIHVVGLTWAFLFLFWFYSACPLCRKHFCEWLRSLERAAFVALTFKNWWHQSEPIFSFSFFFFFVKFLVMEKMIGPQLIAQIDWNSLYKLIGKLVLVEWKQPMALIITFRLTWDCFQAWECDCRSHL